MVNDDYSLPISFRCKKIDRPDAAIAHPSNCDARLRIEPQTAYRKNLHMDRRLLILAVGMFAMGTDNFVVAGILPGVAASLHTSVSLAGMMVTFYALTYAVAAPVMAAVAGSSPRQPPLGSPLRTFLPRIML